jgi:hypothetical protein
MTLSVPVITAAIGDPISVTWKLFNNSNATLLGTIAYFRNDVPLNNASAINNLAVAKHNSTSGAQTIQTVPGVNKITVEFVHTGTVQAPASPKPVQPLQADGKPPKNAPLSTNSVPVNTVVACNTAWFNASPATTAVGTALTPSQRTSLFRDYSPLLLYSFDHGSDEQYAPIDVLAFIQASSLDSQISGVANQAQGSLTAKSILNPTNNPVNAMGSIITPATQPSLPVNLYLEPSETAQHGAEWATVMARQDPQAGTAFGTNVGLYGQAVLMDLARFNSYADPALKDRLTARYNCDPSGKSCPRQVIKIEYWQFFGYSFDFYDPVPIEAGAIQRYINHVGDWCTVQLFVDASWWQAKLYERSILAVYHYLHGHQVGFDMQSSTGEPAVITVPIRPSNTKGLTFSAKEFLGPNFKQSVKLSVEKDGHWLPLGGPNMTEQLDHAQNNVLQLAADPLMKTFQHPVVYVEWGGHEFWPTPDWSIFGASKHNGTGQFSYFGSFPTDVSFPLFIDTGPEPDDVQLVHYFAGYWGNPGDGGPPPGPVLHKEWLWDVTPAGLFNDSTFQNNLPF